MTEKKIAHPGRPTLRQFESMVKVCEAINHLLVSNPTRIARLVHSRGRATGIIDTYVNGKLVAQIEPSFLMSVNGAMSLAFLESRLAEEEFSYALDYVRSLKLLVDAKVDLRKALSHALRELKDKEQATSSRLASCHPALRGAEW
jgi:hypothetical protein